MVLWHLAHLVVRSSVSMTPPTRFSNSSSTTSTGWPRIKKHSASELSRLRCSHLPRASGCSKPGVVSGRLRDNSDPVWEPAAPWRPLTGPKKSYPWPGPVITNHVRYSVGDVTALDFPDGHFDGVRCERVLQHLQDPDAAINEFTRVVRPGGRVCVIDTDWSSLVWDGFEYLDEAFECLDELTGSIRTMGDDRMAGRAIRSRMVRAGLRETTVFPVTVRFTSPTDAAVVSAVFDRSAMKERLPGELFDRFFASLDQSADRGDFLFAVTMWICVGRVAS